MSKTKHAHSRLEDFATAIQSMSIEAIPVFARIGQETGLGASLPEDTPAERAPAARRARVRKTTARKKTAAKATKRR